MEAIGSGGLCYLIQEITLTPEELKANRDKLGMTQDELAEAMGYTDKQAISLKERGKRKVNSRDEKILSELLKKRK